MHSEQDVSENILASTVELKLCGLLLALISLRMCRLANLNPQDWEWKYRDPIIFFRSRELGLNYERLSETHRVKLEKKLGAILRHDPERQKNAVAGALMNHEHMSAFEGAINSLLYWKVIQQHTPAIFEMKIDAADIASGAHQLIQGGNRKGLALVLCVFFAWTPRLFGGIGT